MMKTVFSELLSTIQLGLIQLAHQFKQFWHTLRFVKLPFRIHASVTHACNSLDDTDDRIKYGFGYSTILRKSLEHICTGAPPSIA